LEHEFLDYALEQRFGEMHFKVCPKTGMKAIIAIHSTKLGPALGGCRFIEYPNNAAAIKDAMRLAVGMSYKAALINLPLGGGKAVLIKPKGPFDRQAYMRDFGRFIHELNGRYITALDSGTTLNDMDLIAEETSYIASLSKHNGDPSPSTAKGVWEGIKAAVAFQLGRDDLSGLHIAVQGIGHVGYPLLKLLHESGARLTVADVVPQAVEGAVKEFGAKAVSSERIHQVPCDVFAPCALGAVLNEHSIPQLQTSIVAGAANNQLAQPSDAHLLQERGILYAPDFVINAGGLVYAASKYLHTSQEQVERQIKGIFDSLTQIFTRAAQEHSSPSDVADALAQEKLA
jgi:leucine dehydrogenase